MASTGTWGERRLERIAYIAYRWRRRENGAGKNVGHEPYKHIGRFHGLIPLGAASSIALSNRGVGKPYEGNYLAEGGVLVLLCRLILTCEASIPPRRERTS